jgi:adenylosuccinate synthase
LQFLHSINLAKAQALLLDLPDSPQVAAERDLLIADDWSDWLIDAYRAVAAQARIVSGEYLGAIMQQPGAAIFEGAQGALLDEWHGFHPHTTWSTTTLENADLLLAEVGYTGTQTRIGITRAYATRHGAGPLITEDTALTRALPDPCNGYGIWQGGFRVGWLDLVMLRYALEVVGPLDYLAVTCLDRLAELSELRICRRYRYETLTIDRIAHSSEPRSLAYQAQMTANLARCWPLLEIVPDRAALLDLLTAELRMPIGLISEGPTCEDKRLTQAPGRNRRNLACAGRPRPGGPAS